MLQRFVELKIVVVNRLVNITFKSRVWCDSGLISQGWTHYQLMLGTNEILAFKHDIAKVK